MSYFPPREEWKKCALCGNTVHPYQEMSGQPLVDGIVCVQCEYTRVDATRKNNGIPSHKEFGQDNHGKWRTIIVKDKKSEDKK